MIGHWKTLNGSGDELKLSARITLWNRTGKTIRIAVLDDGDVELWEVGE